MRGLLHYRYFVFVIVASSIAAGIFMWTNQSISDTVHACIRRHSYSQVRNGAVGKLMKKNANLVMRSKFPVSRGLDKWVPPSMIGEVAVCYGEHDEQINCEEPPVQVHDIILEGEYDEHSHLICPGVARGRDGHFYAIDRTNKNLNMWYFGNYNPLPFQHSVLRRQILSLFRTAQTMPAKEVNVIDEPVYWAFDEFLRIPTHAVEDLFDVASAYHNLGITLPWLMPDVSNADPLTARDYKVFSDFFTIHMNVSVIHFNVGETYFIKRAHIPYMGHGLRKEGATFRNEVLIPRVLKRLKEEKKEPPQKKVLVQVKMSSGPSTHSGARSYPPSASFSAILDKMDGVVFGDASMSMEEKAFYVNSVDLLITSWGSAHLLATMLRRDDSIQRTVVLVHPGYYIETSWRPEGAREFCRERKMKFIWVESLDEVTQDDLLNDDCDG